MPRGPFLLSFSINYCLKIIFSGLMTDYSCGMIILRVVRIAAIACGCKPHVRKDFGGSSPSPPTT